MTTNGKTNAPPNPAAAPSSPVAEIPVQVETQKDSTIKQISEVSMAQAVQTFVLMEAKANAEAAELQKRLVMQQFRPCKVYPVLVYHDGLRWVCEYAAMANEFQETDGVPAVAYGMCPEEAMQNFDALWVDTLSESSEEEEGEEEEPGNEDI
jgi:hypothetical protein